MLTANDVLGLIISDAGRIATAISTGAQWEVWMQVELACIFRANGFNVARELPYPYPFPRMRLDLAVQDPAGAYYAIELKVESATNSGPAVVRGVEEDVVKIGRFNIEGLADKWVVGVAYSAAAKGLFRELAAEQPQLYITQEAEGVSVLIVNADSLLAL